MKISPLSRLFGALRAFIAVLLSGIFFTGCTSMQHVGGSEMSRLHALVKPGDEVVCTLRDGTTASFKVASVDVNLLVGEDGRRVAASDIAQVEVKRLDTTKSVLLGLAIAGVVAIIAIAAGGGGGGGSGGY